MPVHHRQDPGRQDDQADDDARDARDRLDDPVGDRREVDIGEAGREARQAIGRGHTNGDEKRVGLGRERATKLRFDRIDRVLDLSGTRQGPEQVPDPGHEGRHDDDDDADKDRHHGQHAEQRGQQARHEPVEGIDDRPDHVGDQPADHERQQGWPRSDRKPHHGSDHRDRQHHPRQGGGRHGRETGAEARPFASRPLCGRRSRRGGPGRGGCGDRHRRVVRPRLGHRSALALEDRAGDVGLVDDEREHRPVAPAAEEQVAVDVHAGIREGARRVGPSRPAGRRPR